MTRFIDLRIQVSDEEFAAFMARLAERGQPLGMTGDADQGDMPAAAGQTVDSAGIPWIDGIHASTKTVTKDGKWRSAKGVSNEQRAAAEAPYKQQQQPPAAPQPPTASGTPFHVPGSIAGVPGGVTLTAPQPPAMPGFPQQQPPAMPGMPMPGFPQQQPPAPPAPVSYDDVSTKYGQLVSAGKANDQTMYQIYQKLGIVDPASITTNESLRRAILDHLNAIG